MFFLSISHFLIMFSLGGQQSQSASADAGTKTKRDMPRALYVFFSYQSTVNNHAQRAWLGESP